jgi:hypothetical protein
MEWIDEVEVEGEKENNQKERKENQKPAGPQFLINTRVNKVTKHCLD